MYPSKIPKAVKEYNQSYAIKHRDTYTGAYRSRYADKKLFIQEVLGTGCVDCAEDRAEVIEYHHPKGEVTPTGRKRIGPAAMGWERLKEEIMHLIAICANCHMLRHHGQAGRGRPRQEAV